MDKWSSNIHGNADFNTVASTKQNFLSIDFFLELVFKTKPDPEQMLYQISSQYCGGGSGDGNYC